VVDLARVSVDLLYSSYLSANPTVNRLGDVINNWRNTLDLEPIPASVGPVLVENLKIPFTYCWSPALVPKPLDWGEQIGTWLHSALSTDHLTNFFQTFAAFSSVIRHATIHLQTSTRSSKPASDRSTLALAASLSRIHQE
jgi:hypothetical protein